MEKGESGKGGAGGRERWKIEKLKWRQRNESDIFSTQKGKGGRKEGKKTSEQTKCDTIIVGEGKK